LAKKIRQAPLLLLFIPVLVLLLPVIALALAAYFINRVLTYFLVWLLWIPYGKRVLVIYSNSPVWHDYFEAEIIPLLKDRCELLNWSERKKWNRWNLAVRVFKSFSGGRGFNPMVLVFRPFRRAEVFRFFYAFRELKRGDPWAVEKMKRNLMDCLEIPTAPNLH
jgi:hypothetical protein